MAGEAQELDTLWLRAETVAAIADDMLVPESIRDAMQTRRSRTRRLVRGANEPSV